MFKPTVGRVRVDTDINSVVIPGKHQFADLVSDLGISELLNTELPVKIKEIAFALGAKSVRQANIPASGMMLPSGDGFLVLLNKNDNRKRQKFSCAHEIAHAIYDPKFNPSMRRAMPSAANALEKKCNKLASYLLMPDPAFSNYVECYGNAISTIVKLARVFETSIQATAARFIDVITEPCALVVSSVKSGRSGRKLRVKWAYQNISKLNNKSFPFIPCGKSFDLRTSVLAYETNQIQSDFDEITIGKQGIRTYMESKAFGRRDSRYVMSLIFPFRSEK